MFKDQVRSSDTPKKIAKIQFGVFAPQEIYKFSELEIVNRELFRVADRKPNLHGCLDPRLGISDKNSVCETCGQKLADCIGHYGHIKLELPVFHVGFFKAIVQILQNVCKSCCSILLSEKDRRLFLQQLRRPGLDDLQKKVIIKRINERCRKVPICSQCGDRNGPVKKVGTLKIVHEKYPTKKADQSTLDFHEEFDAANINNPDLKTHLNRAQEDLNPLKVLNIFSRISADDCEALGLDPVHGRPENLIWTYLPVPPVCIRPSVAMEGAAGSNEDDLTVKLTEIIHTNSVIKNAIEKGSQISVIMEDWEFLQLQIALYINSEMPGVPLPLQSQKSSRGFCQRLKGKTGRFRGNLSGKRVDFSGRTVISPDPNLKINEVAIPVHVARILTYPEKVFSHNLERLKQCIINGPEVHPGANFIEHLGGRKIFLKFVRDRKKLATELKIGDLVERHLSDGDIVLFNRQPSLHKLSIMCHFAKIRPYRTFRLNECVCGPYNADFDGDEMNVHVPQTEEARTEAMVLMGVKENLITPRNGEPVIAATQDFITACYILSRKDVFFDRSQFTQICCFMADANLHIDLPPPAIRRPMQLWTGKQLFGVLMKPNKLSKVLVSLETKTKSYTEGKDLCYKDGWLVIRNSEIMCGSLDKSNVGSGSKASIFHVILRDYSAQETIDCMSRLAKLCARWMGNQGFSIGIDDVRPGASLSSKKELLVETGYNKCNEFIQQFERGDLQLAPGCTAEQTLEAKITGELSKIRDDAGQICLNELQKYNSPLIMAISGSKGSKINISQMVACVGQQVVNGTRIPEGFVGRTLPHFRVGARTPSAKGFVKNSFYSGLTPTEFFFHTMGGREGLVDTAVKTAETGYMARRLMKALEDLSVQYDLSVRSSTGNVVQFKYGDDGLDPASMEGADKPVDLPHLLMHCQWVQGGPEERSLLPFQIKQSVATKLASKEFKACNQLFLDDLTQFFSTFATDLSNIRKRFGLIPALTADEIAKKPESEYYSKGVSTMYRITESQLKLFLDISLHKYLKAFIEPGTACGAIGAQSISEPGTQMTLKTFHFAGVASMNVTLGVPRIKEIINASKVISTPIITANLVAKTSMKSAKIVKARIEKTILGEIVEYIQEVYRPNECFLLIKLDTDLIQTMMLEINLDNVCTAILGSRLKLKRENLSVISADKLKVYPINSDKISPYFSLQSLKQTLPKVAVKGNPTIVRAVVNVCDTANKHYNLLVEGYGLLSVMTTDGVDASTTSSNHVIETEKTLGIEAARSTIINEIQYTMGNHGMSIDIRHVKLLGDLMTCMGEVLGITRFGIAKMKDSVLMLASFEKTTDHLFDAAIYSKTDAIDGVSECIIMGVPMPVGTGLFKILQHDPKEKKNKATFTRPLLFDVPEYHPRLNFDK